MKIIVKFIGDVLLLLITKLSLYKPPSSSPTLALRETTLKL